MALLSPSLKGLQILIKACEKYCFDWDICLNPKKTKNMAFGKRVTNLCPLFLNGGKIDWVSSWKYLGVDLNSHHSFDCTIDGKRLRTTRYFEEFSHTDILSLCGNCRHSLAAQHGRSLLKSDRANSVRSFWNTVSQTLSFDCT